MKTIRQRIFLGFFYSLVMGLFLFSCSKGNLASSEDGLRIQKIDQILETLQKGFLEKDSTEILNFVSSQGEIGSRDIEKKLNQIFKKRDFSQLRLFLEKVVREKERTKAYIHWELESKVVFGEIAVVEKGDVIFIFTGEKDLLLDAIEGYSPFDVGGADLP